MNAFMRKTAAAAAASLLLAAFAARGEESAAAPKVNVNQASATQLAFLPRIGAKVAERVVEYRKANGPFARPEELMEVKGIGEKLFVTLKPYLAVSGPTTLTAKVRSGSASKRAGSPATKPATQAAPSGKGR